MAWVSIPAGQVTLQATKSVSSEIDDRDSARRSASDRAHGKGQAERKTREVRQTERTVFGISPFRIARYSVTNIQFQAFIDAQEVCGNVERWEGIERPEAPSMSHWSEANHPRQNVTWYEAVAFCRWLTQKYKEKKLLEKDAEIRLPTEWEWQQAATGGDTTREYPWEGRWDPALCNSNGGHLQRVTAVGVYPQGQTLHGVLDMAGNVSEWCLNKYSKPTDRSAVSIDKSGDDRSIRGGSWYDIQEVLRSSHRRSYPPNVGYDDVGFRLVWSLTIVSTVPILPSDT